MALQLPKLPNTSALKISAAKTTPGAKVGVGINKAATGAPKALFGASAPKIKTQTQHSANDQFMLQNPYDPAQISNLANQSYNSDVAGATKLAGMGTLTPDQENARAAQQGTNIQGIYQALQQQLAGVTTAGVAQSNAGAASLAGQNAATAATGNQTASALGVPNTGVQYNPAAVIASQGAAAGTAGGALQTAALSAGAQGQVKALASGASNIQNDQLTQQKALQSLLSGLPTESARETTMQNANQQTHASNLQTALSLYQQGLQQQLFEESLGEKDKAAQQGLLNQRYLAGISQSGQTGRTDATIAAEDSRAAADRAARLKAAKITQTGANGRSAAQIAAANQRAKDAAAAKTGPGSYKSYKVTVLMPQPAKVSKDPVTGLPTSTPVKPKREVKTVPANVWNRYVASGPVNRRKKAILGIPDAAQVQQHTGY